MKQKLPFIVIGVIWVLAMASVISAKPPQAENFTAPKNAVILIIRHAEKPDAGHTLSASGDARAQAYVNYFKNYSVDGKPLKLDYLFATKDSGNSHRPRLTLDPFAKALGLKIDSRFNNNQFQQMAREIQNHAPGTNILICWHHGNIPELLRALGANPKKILPGGKWPDDEFDWLIQLRYDANGRLFDGQRIDENLTPVSPAQPVPAAP
jgi:broad specificity phosphatase PhoE